MDDEALQEIIANLRDSNHHERGFIAKQVEKFREITLKFTNPPKEIIEFYLYILSEISFTTDGACQIS